MAAETLVEEIRRVVSGLQAQGEMALAMLLATSSEPGAPWNFLVSAEWMDNRTTKEVVDLLTKLIREEVARKNWSSILRATVLRTGDPFVQAINRGFSVEKGTLSIQDCNIFGIEVPRAIILESRQPKSLSLASH